MLIYKHLVTICISLSGAIQGWKNISQISLYGVIYQLGLKTEHTIGVSSCLSETVLWALID